MVFGGFGRNVFNPALSGRAFVYVSFGVPMTSKWVLPAWGEAGGFALWQADAVSGATPLVRLAGGEVVDRISMVIGNISGSLGETSVILIVICGLFLIIRKVASFRIVVGGLAGLLLFQTIFWFAGVGKFYDPLSAVIGGSFLFGLMFCITDPISASQTTNPGRWIYGIIYGILCALIRTFSSWPEAVTFAVLIANMFAPLLDHMMKQAKSGKKKAASA
jgi:Na+-transporting NADH:ubiquinone oxidoreductase subunit B